MTTTLSPSPQYCSEQIAHGDMALLDMGAEYHCYASDITCSFPVVDQMSGAVSRDGAFSQKQRVTYEAVLDAQTAVIAALRPGGRDGPT